VAATSAGGAELRVGHRWPMRASGAWITVQAREVNR
jgi:hypothetical protein